MADYTFLFPPAASGFDVTVRDRSGETVNTGTLDTDADVVEYTVDLPWGGYYQAIATSGAASYKAGAEGAVTPDAPGATETAYFVGTATGDTSGDQHDLTFVQHPDYPAQDFASAVGGQIVCPGPVVVGMIYRAGITLDFTEATGFSTATTSPDTDVTIKFSRVDGDGFAGNAGGPYASIPVGTSGTVFEIDAVERGLTEGPRCAANEELIIKGTVNAFGFDAAGDPVTDGVLTATVLVAVTPETLPEYPEA